jgi:hypothetical protein
MHNPAHLDSRIRTWTLQRELVRASLVPRVRGHVLAPARQTAGAAQRGNLRRSA